MYTVECHPDHFTLSVYHVLYLCCRLRLMRVMYTRECHPDYIGRCHPQCVSCIVFYVVDWGWWGWCTQGSVTLNVYHVLYFILYIGGDEGDVHRAVSPSMCTMYCILCYRLGVMYTGECHPGDELFFSLWQDSTSPRKLHFYVTKRDSPVFLLQLECLQLQQSAMNPWKTL